VGAALTSARHAVCRHGAEALSQTLRRWCFKTLLADMQADRDAWRDQAQRRVDRWISGLTGLGGGGAGAKACYQA